MGVVEEFFQQIKDRVRTMKQLPRGGYTLNSEGDEDFERFKDVDKKYGWPNEFRKEEYAAAIAAIET